jgi:hypothetical protein
LLRWNQGHQRNTAPEGKGRAVEKHRHMADMVPQQSGNDARHQFQEAQRRVVPANPARSQAVGHEVRRQRLSDGAKNALIQSVAGEQHCNQGDVALDKRNRP